MFIGGLSWQTTSGIVYLLLMTSHHRIDILLIVCFLSHTIQSNVLCVFCVNVFIVNVLF